MPGPTTATIKRLFTVAGNRCAFPGCTATLVTGNTVTAEICHIKAQNVGGPRYDPDQSDKERHGFENLVLMCGDHHKVIDNKDNLETYTVEWLREVKAQHESLHAGGPEPSDEVVARLTIPSPEAVSAHRVALREKLEAEARRRWGGMAFYIQEEGATLPVEASPYQTGRLGARENLLQALSSADRLLVLGEPGSGKTVSLERLAWGLCGDEKANVPVLVPLRDYAEKSLAEWVLSFLRETGHLRLDDEKALEAFLDQGTCCCTFLFDGLNEVAPPYRNRLIEDLQLWMKAHPRHPMILTSRSQDELWRRLRGEVDGTVVVQPVGDEQMEAYLVAHLGEHGRMLCKRLDGRLREMARTPLILWLVKEAGAAGESLPGNRGELYERFVSRMLQRDTQQRQMDVEIPDRVKIKVLTSLAYHLGLEQRISCPQEEAVAAVAQALGDGQVEQVVQACARHGLLAGEETVWFAPHQTVQEYFAALALQEMVEQEQRLGWGGRLRRGVRRVLTGKGEGLAGLAADDWWMETFVQLAGLVDDADWLVREVARVNPWLAWWCVGCVEEGRRVTKETRAFVENHSMRLLKSERVADRRRAVGTLARVRSERAVQLLFQVVADEDAEVAELATQALVEMGEGVWKLVAEALQSKDRRQWSAALRYLRASPDHHLWAEIPGQVWEEFLEAADRCRAVAVLTRAQGEQIVPQLFRAAGDKDIEVAELAVQALTRRKEMTQPLVAKNLEGSERCLQMAALRYLAVQPNNPWAAQPLWRVATSEDVEVAELAVQALAEMGEAVRGPAMEALQHKEDHPQWRAALRYLEVMPSDNSMWAEVEKMAQTDMLNLARNPKHYLHQAGLAYLGALLGQPIVWVESGPFLMGSDKGKDPQAFGSEMPQHEVTLAGYWIWRYPVTNAEYRKFIEGGGYQTQAYWTEAGWQWKGDRTQPLFWDVKEYSDPRQPVVGTTVYEAVAYCCWLSERVGMMIRLPSEGEWEKAARGTDGRIYPWGDEFDKSKCNTRESGISTTTLVGKYSPKGDSPYGCADMAGNVWEWCATKWEHSYESYREDNDPEGDASRVLRGGSFGSSASYARCAFRYENHPLFRDGNFGFRCKCEALPFSYRSSF